MYIHVYTIEICRASSREFSPPGIHHVWPIPRILQRPWLDTPLPGAKPAPATAFGCGEQALIYVDLLSQAVSHIDHIKYVYAWKKENTLIICIIDLSESSIKIHKNRGLGRTTHTQVNQVQSSFHFRTARNSSTGSGETKKILTCGLVTSNSFRILS